MSKFACLFLALIVQVCFSWHSFSAHGWLGDFMTSKVYEEASGARRLREQAAINNLVERRQEAAVLKVRQGDYKAAAHEYRLLLNAIAGKVETARLQKHQAIYGMLCKRADARTLN